MKKLCWAIVFVCSAFLSSAQIVVQVDYDKEFDFSAYKNFLISHGTFVKNDQDHAAAEAKIDEILVTSLKDKGLNQVTGGTDTNFVVTFIGGAKKKAEMEALPTRGGYHYAPGWGAPVYNVWWQNEYKTGTLIIDVYDYKTKQLVWRAYCETEFSNDNTEKTLNTIVKRAFKKFPPKTKKK